MSDNFLRRPQQHPRDTTRARTDVTALDGKEGLKRVTIRDTAAGQAWDLRIEAVFITLGTAPNTASLSGLV